MREFYGETLDSLLQREVLDRHARTLVVCGGNRDRNVLRALEFSNVTIANLDTRMTPQQYAPYAYMFEDAERLSFDDKSFDQVFVHDGLHHCRSPHAALLEMYRVAAKAIVIFESRQSFLMEVVVRLGLSTQHEVEAVVDNDLEFGGMRNSWLPNRVFRWTENEIEKTINTYDPIGPVKVSYFHGLRVPDPHPGDPGARRRRTILAALKLPAKLLLKLAPKQCNRFAFCVEKPTEYYPWIAKDGQGLDRDWLKERYAAPILYE